MNSEQLKSPPVTNPYLAADKAKAEAQLRAMLTVLEKNRVITVTKGNSV